jgi:hypothetical protein
MPFTGNRNRGFPGQLSVNSSEPDWPENGRHYQVAVLQADGLYELEKALNNGNIGDFWIQGRELGPGDNEIPFFPNTDGYAFGETVRTGVSVKSFSRSGTIMSFEVTGLGGSRPLPMEPSLAPEYSPSCSTPSILEPTPRESFPKPPERNVTVPPTVSPEPDVRREHGGCREGSTQQPSIVNQQPTSVPSSEPETSAPSSTPTKNGSEDQDTTLPSPEDDIPSEMSGQQRSLAYKFESCYWMIASFTLFYLNVFGI